MTGSGPAATAGDRSVDVHAKIDELGAVIEGARAMPMSASCIVNRGEVLAMLEDLRDLLPAELGEAQALLDERDAVLEQGRVTASGIVAAAEREQARLVSDTDVAAEARRSADQLLQSATAEAERMRREVDEYVDARLAHFEITLQKTMAAVTHGRDKLSQQLDGPSAVRLSDEDDQPSVLL